MEAKVIKRGKHQSGKKQYSIYYNKQIIMTSIDKDFLQNVCNEINSREDILSKKECKDIAQKYSKKKIRDIDKSYCPCCNNKIDRKDNYCKYCGTELNENNVEFNKYGDFNPNLSKNMSEKLKAIILIECPQFKDNPYKAYEYILKKSIKYYKLF